MISNFKDLLFMEIPQKRISLDKIKEFINDENAKRIDFSSTHANSLKKYNNEWKITLPFRDTIQPILHHTMGDAGKLFDNKFSCGVWRKISNDEHAKWKQFIDDYNNIIFLRDNLDLSLSLSMNYENDTEARTEIGELEYKAKYQEDDDAEKELVKLCSEWLKKLPYYKDADFICAIPSSNPKIENLPQRIINSLEDIQAINISDKVSWTSKNKSIKETENVDGKIQLLEDSHLTIDETDNIKGKTIIIFDDLYMSGVTMQYVAMKLKEAGAKRIFGFSIVKSRKNTVAK